MTRISGFFFSAPAYSKKKRTSFFFPPSPPPFSAVLFDCFSSILSFFFSFRANPDNEMVIACVQHVIPRDVKPCTLTRKPSPHSFPASVLKQSFFKNEFYLFPDVPLSFACTFLIARSCTAPRLHIVSHRAVHPPFPHVSFVRNEPPSYITVPCSLRLCPSTNSPYK